MPWNPEVYNQFKNIRYQPFFDLAALITADGLHTAIDLGCGTGEQTSILSAQFPQTHFLGVDASEEMLSQGIPLASERLRFQQATTESIITTGQKWDLVFSNAALQWSDNHETLFPALLSLLTDNGQFAVQMPVQNDNILNRLLLELAQEAPFSEFLNGWTRPSPVLSMDRYAQLLFESGLQDLQVVQKVYPIIAQEHDTLFDFISGSALIPYLERISQDEKERFIKAFKERIKAAFPKLPAIYAFKRLLLYGRKKAL